MSKRGSTSKKKIILILIIAVILIAAFALVLHFLENRSLQDEQFGDTGGWGTENGEDLSIVMFDDKYYASNEDIDAYLIAGTDAGGNDLGDGYNGELADFITVMIINNTAEKYGFYQIDRNTITDVSVINESGDFDDYVSEQICTAHWYGRNEEERNDNLVNVVTDLLGGLDIDGYFILNMKDIGAVNHAIGGVVVDITEDMTDVDPAFREGESVLLTDDQAEKFIRARMDVGDGTNAARMARQRQYMQNAYNMVIGQLRENPEYVNDLYDQLTDKVVSDSEGRDISRIANELIMYKNMGIITFAGKTKTGDTIGEGILHEEFYINKGSILSNLRKVVNFEEYTEPEDEDEVEDIDMEDDESDEDEYIDEDEES